MNRIDRLWPSDSRRFIVEVLIADRRLNRSLLPLEERLASATRLNWEKQEWIELDESGIGAQAPQHLNLR